MIISKGIEIIPKRDKVTIASNISGRWEDYSIDTYQGKVLKEASERFKSMIKAGQALDAEVSSLKQLLNQQPTVVAQEMKRIDFWESPPEQYVEVPAAEVNAIELLRVAGEKKKEETLPQVTEFVEKVTEALENTVEYLDDSEGPKYVIHAYINKSTGRQMYLAGWDENLDWMISAVPYACTRSKCEKLIKKAQKQIAEVNAQGRLRSRFPANIQFELVEYHDSSKDSVSYEEICRQAEALRELNRASKRSK